MPTAAHRDVPTKFHDLAWLVQGHCANEAGVAAEERDTPVGCVVFRNQVDLRGVGGAHELDTVPVPVAPEVGHCLVRRPQVRKQRVRGCTSTLVGCVSPVLLA